jgi:putative endonuclease
MASKPQGTLYIGVTSYLVRRVYEHRTGVVDGFSQDHDVKTLVFFEPHASAEAAITREKQLKKWKRDWKIQLIEKNNPFWDDLYDAIT